MCPPRATCMHLALFSSDDFERNLLLRHILFSKLSQKAKMSDQKSESPVISGNYYNHSAEELALIQALKPYLPSKYRVPAYAANYWLYGVTLYVNDVRIPSVNQIRAQIAASKWTSGSGSASGSGVKKEPKDEPTTGRGHCPV